MEIQGDSNILRVVIVVAIAAIIGLAVLGGLYAWYLYKTTGVDTTHDTSSALPTDSGDMQTVLKTLTPKSDTSMLTADEDAKLRASLTAPSNSQAHPVDQATLDSLTPPKAQ